MTETTESTATGTKRTLAFRCGECGGPFRVRDTCHPAANVIVRYRGCLICGARIVTEERLSATGRPRENPGRIAASGS